jgi:hypothetical protein
LGTPAINTLFVERARREIQELRGFFVGEIVLRGGVFRRFHGGELLTAVKRTRSLIGWRQELSVITGSMRSKKIAGA